MNSLMFFRFAMMTIIFIHHLNIVIPGVLLAVTFFSYYLDLRWVIFIVKSSAHYAKVVF